MEQVPMTVQGAEALRKELHYLKTEARQKVIQAIAEARAHGDLRENAEYHAAREQQSFMEGRIQDLEDKLSRVRVIDITKLENTGKVVFGSTVVLLNPETDEEVRYHIVGDDEADLKERKISISSPIARGLIGKLVDDVVDIKTPAGTVTYEVIAVEYI